MSFLERIYTHNEGHHIQKTRKKICSKRSLALRLNLQESLEIRLQS